MIDKILMIINHLMKRIKFSAYDEMDLITLSKKLKKIDPTDPVELNENKIKLSSKNKDGT